MIMVGRPKSEPFNANEQKAIRDRYENGESIATISADIHVRTDKVRAAIVQSGGSLKQRGSWATKRRKISEAQTQEIADKYLRGESKRAIARDLNVSLATITHHLKKSGIGVPHQ